MSRKMGKNKGKEIKTPASKKKLEEQKSKKIKRKERKRTNRKKRRRILRFVGVILFLAILVSIALYLVATKFVLKKIMVSGNETYTAEEVTNAVRKSEDTKNTLVFFLKHRKKEETFLPFIQRAEVKLKNRNTIEITIKEKKRAGKIIKNGYNWYYDRRGILLERTKKNYSNIVTVEGLSYRELTLNEKIPIVQTGGFEILMTISQSIEKYGTPIQTIEMKNTEDIKLISDKITVNLGNAEFLEQKMEELYPALKAAKENNLQGTIDMRHFSETQPRIIFY